MPTTNLDESVSTRWESLSNDELHIRSQELLECTCSVPMSKPVNVLDWNSMSDTDLRFNSEKLLEYVMSQDEKYFDTLVISGDKKTSASNHHSYQIPSDSAQDEYRIANMFHISEIKHQLESLEPMDTTTLSTGKEPLYHKAEEHATRNNYIVGASASTIYAICTCPFDRGKIWVSNAKSFSNEKQSVSNNYSDYSVAISTRYIEDANDTTESTSADAIQHASSISIEYHTTMNLTGPFCNSSSSISDYKDMIKGTNNVSKFWMSTKAIAIISTSHEATYITSSISTHAPALSTTSTIRSDIISIGNTATSTCVDAIQITPSISSTSHTTVFLISSFSNTSVSIDNSKDDMNEIVCCGFEMNSNIVQHAYEYSSSDSMPVERTSFDQKLQTDDIRLWRVKVLMHGHSTNSITA